MRGIFSKSETMKLIGKTDGWTDGGKHSETSFCFEFFCLWEFGKFQPHSFFFHESHSHTILILLVYM